MAALCSSDVETIDNDSRALALFVEVIVSPVVEKETLGLVLAVDHFDVYLGSTPFTIKVYTDHNPLTFLKTMKNKNQRLVRWSLALQEYDLDIQHIAGVDNVVADALSRCIA